MQRLGKSVRNHFILGDPIDGDSLLLDVLAEPVLVYVNILHVGSDEGSTLVD